MFNDIETPIKKKGDAIRLSLNGTVFEGVVLETTILNYTREYHVEFGDGSRKWFRAAVFQCLKN